MGIWQWQCPAPIPATLWPLIRLGWVLPALRHAAGATSLRASCSRACVESSTTCPRAFPWHRGLLTLFPSHWGCVQCAIAAFRKSRLLTPLLEPHKHSMMDLHTPLLEPHKHSMMDLQCRIRLLAHHSDDSVPQVPERS